MATINTQQVRDVILLRSAAHTPPRAWPTGSRALQRCIRTWSARRPSLPEESCSKGFEMIRARGSVAARTAPVASARRDRALPRPRVRPTWARAATVGVDVEKRLGRLRLMPVAVVLG
eukprot:1674966-Prymnesium_polylepis.1